MSARLFGAGEKRHIYSPRRSALPAPGRLFPMQSPPAGARRPLLPALQGLRFFAALHVVLLHSLGARWLPGPVRAGVQAGYTSTSLLFVLSGFVLVWVYTDAEGRFRGGRRAFWTARAARVYPLAVASHLLVLPLWVHAHGGAGAWAQGVAAFSGMQGWLPPLANALNAPAWAVTFLLFAYALFPWMAERARALSTRGLAAAMGAAWLLSTLPGALFLLLSEPGETLRTALYTFPLLRLPEFAFGVLLGRWYVARGRPALPAWAAPAALAAWALVIMGVPTPRELLHNGLLAPLQGVLVVGLADGGGALGRALSRRRIQKLGEAGLAVFLLHVPLLGWVQAAGWLPGPSPVASVAVYLGYLLGTVALSLAAMRWLVDPVAARVRRWMERPTSVPLPDASAVHAA